jgi:hypothetical protein
MNDQNKMKEQQMNNRIMTEEVHHALAVILEEFGDCDLGPRLDYYEESDEPDYNEKGKELDRCWNLVVDWHERYPIYESYQQVLDSEAERIADADRLRDEANLHEGG